MKSLFWKIFLSFWLSLLVFAGLSFWITSQYLDSVRAQGEQLNPRQSYILHRQQLEMIAQHQGLSGVRDWLNELDKREAIPYLLIDEQGNDLLERSVPLRLKQRIERYESRWHERPRPHTRPVIIENQHYLFLPDFQSITLGRLLHRPRVMLIPVLVALLVSGIACYLLARYLVSPITRLRKATQQIAEGNLAARVTPQLGNRQDELIELATDFDHMTERLQVLLNSHKQLLSDASHELRSPLARLQVALGIAQQRNPEAISNELQRIELEAERLNELIGQLLSLSRLDSQHQLDTESVDIDRLMETIVSDASYEANESDREVSLINHQTVTIEANPALLSSAFENVIRNAIRHTPPGTCIEIRYEIDDRQQLKISVCDQGPGIPEDMLKTVFDPFVRVSKARERQTGGYGLGLAIARRAIELHQGQIWAKNQHPQGLCINISLPLKSIRK